MPRSQRHSIRAAALTLAVLLLGAGCLFQPRVPEDPRQTPEVTWVPPAALGNALGNMQRALDNKQLINYGKSFSPVSFELILDPADEAELGQNEFATWSASQEEQRMSGILSSTTATLAVYWVPRDSLDLQETRYYEDLNYRLEFRGASGTVEYSGRVDLYFQDDGTGQWYITRWVDKRDGSNNRTWGWLRARNRVEF
jgi:hypothetical protein